MQRLGAPGPKMIYFDAKCDSGCATPNCRREHLAGAVSEGEADANYMRTKEVVVRFVVCMRILFPSFLACFLFKILQPNKVMMQFWRSSFNHSCPGIIVAANAAFGAFGSAGLEQGGF